MQSKSNAPAAIVTGASSGIGLAISKALLDMGYTVYGFGRTFDEPYPEDLFAVEMDLLDTGAVLKKVDEITAEADVQVLVNCAGAAYYGLHEELSAKKIAEICRTDLELPMVLTQHLLRRLKAAQGTVINIASVTAVESNPHGAAYGAAKAGLLSFSRSLFDESRKYGLKVTCIMPDLTQTDLYRNADFDVCKESACCLAPQDTSDAVRYVLTQRDGVVVPELMLRPQFHRIERKKPAQ